MLVSASVSTPRPPTTERVVALNRGPWLTLAARAAGAPRRGRRDSPRRPPVHGLRVGARSGRDQRARQRRVVLDEGGVRRSRPASASCSTRSTKRRGAGCHPRALEGRHPRSRRLRPRAERRGDARHRGRRRAEAPSRCGRRRAGGRRARGVRARHRLHPGLAEHPVPAAPQDRLRRTRPLQAGRHGVRERAARGDRRVAARARRVRRARRLTRRCRDVRRRRRRRSGAAAVDRLDAGSRAARARRGARGSAPRSASRSSAPPRSLRRRARIPRAGG